MINLVQFLSQYNDYEIKKFLAAHRKIKKSISKGNYLEKERIKLILAKASNDDERVEKLNKEYTQHQNDFFKIAKCYKIINDFLLKLCSITPTEKSINNFTYNYLKNIVTGEYPPSKQIKNFDDLYFFYTKERLTKNNIDFYFRGSEFNFNESVYLPSAFTYVNDSNVFNLKIAKELADKYKDEPYEMFLNKKVSYIENYKNKLKYSDYWKSIKTQPNHEKI